MGAGRVEHRPEGDVRHHLGRDAHPLEQELRCRLRAGDRAHAVEHAQRGQAEPPVDRCGDARRTRGSREHVDDLVQRLRPRGDEMEGLAVDPLAVHQLVHRRRDEVDRYDVGVAEVRRDQGQPGRQPGEQREQREEVVGAVDLVHLARARVADDDRRPVDPPRDLALLPDEPLRLELRRVVGRR